MDAKCLIGQHDWDGCVCRSCERHRDEGHDLDDKCRCRKCGLSFHEYEIVSKEDVDTYGGYCTFSVNDPCETQCAGCDSYNPLHGIHRTHLKCTRCGCETHEDSEF